MMKRTVMRCRASLDCASVPTKLTVPPNGASLRRSSNDFSSRAILCLWFSVFRFLLPREKPVAPPVVIHAVP
jgi:hypothetical protein